MSAPSVTYTFSNSTTADATQVNQNFTDLINGVSDGTKDLSISALTCSGNVTLNGNTIVGNASSDDLTITASLASTVPIKTTNSYDIGSSTKGLRYVYFGDTSDANTLRIAGQSVGSDVQLILPAYSGTLRNIPSVISTQTTTYAVLASDEFIPVSGASSAFTVTLPTAVGATGKVYCIKRTDQTLANAVTIATTSSQTIDGSTTTTLNTQYEAIEVISDGSNWHVLRRSIPSPRVSFTPTGSWVTNTTYTGYWQRQGTAVLVEVFIDLAGAPTSAALTINMPTNISIDNAILVNSGNQNHLGQGLLYDSGAVWHAVAVQYNGTTSVKIQHDLLSSSYNDNAVNATSPWTWGAGDAAMLTWTAPVSGWKS